MCFGGGGSPKPSVNKPSYEPGDAWKNVNMTGGATPTASQISDELEPDKPRATAAAQSVPLVAGRGGLNMDGRGR